MIIKVSLAFGKLPDMDLDNFAQSVIDAMTGNAAYPTPPVTMANLQTAKDDYTAKLAAAQVGGQADTAAKNNSRAVEKALPDLSELWQSATARRTVQSGTRGQPLGGSRLP